MGTLRYRDLERYGNILLLAAGKEGPATIEHNGKPLVRYMDRIYLPDKPSQLDEQTVRELAELRLILGPELIDSRYTQSVLSYLYKRATAEKGDLRILDFGCGDGNIAALVLTLPKRIRPREVVGVDICPLAINLARERLSSTRLGTAVIIRGNEQMPLEDGYFDAAIANFVMHFPIALQQAKDIFRVLAPGGRFVYNNYYFRRDSEHDNKITNSLQRAGFSIRRRKHIFLRIVAHTVQEIEQAIVECVKPS